ncbi:diguanylate cyclase domain-containing protein [Castellaniella sp.]|uniref:diguanylate cyclase domain-containing protein n=1 Tax=Castellaniella sp. TaxID=1955812 RepID=UPI002AFE7003|nr:diguanylate cyclase [Castellaniella sp.]
MDTPKQRYVFDKPLSAVVGLLFLAIISFIWFAVTHRIYTEREQAVEAAMHANANLAIAFEQEIYRTLKSAEQVAAFVREEIVHRGDSLDLKDWLDRDIIRDSMFTIVSVVNADGVIVDSTLPTPPSVNYADRDFFLAQRHAQNDTLYISRSVLGRISGQWRIPLSLRINQADGSFGGVVVIAIDPPNLSTFYRLAGLGSQDLLAITGLDGYTRVRQIGQDISMDESAKALPWFTRQLDRRHGNFEDKGEFDGVRRLISYRTLANYPLMVVIGTAYDEAIATAQLRQIHYLWVTFAATLVLLAGALGIILGLARQRAIYLALQASETRLAHAATHDPLTGLANRVLFQDRCLRALDASLRHHQSLVLLYLDLDGFKAVNDLHGHACGDLLLQQIAHRLNTQVRSESDDTVARFGGDEFALLLSNLSEHHDAERIIQNILIALAQPFDLQGHEVRISASIGAVLYPQHGQDLNTLVGRADTAMYAAKNAGRNKFLWWRPDLQS